MTKKEKDKREKVEKIMRLLDCTEEEALDVVATDEIIDKGGRSPYDLSVEKEKEAKKMIAVKDRRAKDKVNNMRGKVRAENPTKIGIIAELAEFLTEEVQNVKIVNPSKIITFNVDEKLFKLDLTATKKPSNVSDKTVTPNPTKSEIITKLAEFLTEKSKIEVQNVKIVNQNKIIAFNVSENLFKLDLTATRK